MGYLQIPASALGNFTKAVISVWFRVPTATLATVLGLADDPGLITQGHFVMYPALHKIIPILTFGSATEATFGDVGTFSPISPCFIGIDCVSPFFDPTFAVNLQMPNSCGYTIADNPGAEKRHAAFFMSGRSEFAPTPTQILKVTADVWHHALVSFDLSASCSCHYATEGGVPTFQVTAGPTFSWSFDDVSKVGLSMQPSGGALWNLTPGAVSVAENTIFPDGLFYGAAGDLGSTASWASTSIASSGNPIGTPSSVAFVDNIYNIELARLQLFTGISVDAGSETIRRLFVTAAGKPAAPTLAQTYFEQAPVVRFDSSTDWIDGTNKGSGAAFSPAGAIAAYTPGPDA